ncbi:MAG: tetratricopeptide repeat protein [Truepera sp.]|nr:tetratricopeptide repeat protein [Truepera sp.]
MKWPLIASFLFLLLAEPALAQSLTRIVVLPFNAGQSADTYAIGLAAGLERSLNVIDGVFVPPVGDALNVTQRLEARRELSPETVAAAFNASVVIGGEVGVSGTQAQVQIALAGPAFPETRVVAVQGPFNEPSRLLAAVVNAAVAELGLRISADDRRQLDAMTASAPSLPSLSAVASASLRLQPNLAALEAAAALDGSSSWVLAEQARAQALVGDDATALTVSRRAVEVQPLDIEAWVVRGIVLRTAGDDSAALQAFNAALALNSAHALALAGKGQLSSAELAKPLFEQATQSYPRLVVAYLELAELLSQQDPQLALRRLREGATRVPDSASLHAAIMQQAIRLGDATGAAAYLRQFLASDPGANPNIYALATLLPVDRLGAEALAIVRSGRERHPDSTALVLAEGQLLAQQGDFAAAEAVLQAGVAQAPGHLGLINQLAITQARQGKLDEARATLEAVAQQDARLQFNLAQLYLQAGQSRAAASLLEPLLARYPDDPELFTLLGIALGRSGQFDRALSALEQALALSPNDSQALAAKNALEQNRNVVGGERIELGAAAPAFEAGLAALEQNDLARALSEFRRARAAQDHGLLAFYEGYTLQLQGDLRGAVASYERALADLPNSATVLNNLGFAFFNLGRFDRALTHLAQATQADAANVQAQLNLGLVLYSLNRYRDALGPLERALALDPSLGEVMVTTDTGARVSLAALLDDARRRAQP